MDTHHVPETSGAVPALLLSYVRARAGADAAAEVAARAGLGDVTEGRPRAWITHATSVLLYEAVVDVLDDPDALRDAGTKAPALGLDRTMATTLRGIGGPRRVYRALPRVVSRFTRVNTLQVTGLTRRSFQVDYRLADGHERSPLDCAFAAGLLASVPTLSGGEPAHVHQTRCQRDGHDSCRFTVVVPAGHRWGRRERTALDTAVAAEPEAQVAALRAQLGQVHLAASDLLSSGDVTQALDRIADRAAAAVLAPGHVLVLVDDAGRPVEVRHRGVDAATATGLAPAIAAGDLREDGTTVVDVAAGGRLHGRLAVMHGPAGAADGEVLLLEAYARHAAVALDLLTALDDARTQGARAEALLTLTDSLATAPDEQAAAEVLAASMHEITGCDTASVYRWDPSGGELRRIASAGHTDHMLAGVAGSSLHVDAVPELGNMLARREPQRLVHGEVSQRVNAVMAAVSAKVTVAIPLAGQHMFLGLATANWADPAAADEDAVARAVSVSRQGGTAMEKARLLDTVQHQAEHDALSGLPNRALFTKVLSERLREVGPEQGVAVLFCDIDRFKAVNDELGHAAGDELLRQVAARLRGVCRPSDVLGRLSGDEFALVVLDVDEAAAVIVAERIVETIEVPFRIDGREVRITVSVGVATHTGPDGWGDRMLAAADDAMHVAKGRGRNQIVVAGAVADRVVTPSFEAELGRAVAAEQLRLYYQPVVDVTRPGGPVVTGAEALLRWAHPRLGLLAPGSFLPLAEEAQLVTDLDLWAVDAACRTLAQWPTPEHGEPLTVAVNLAGRTLVDPRLAGAVREALRAHDIAPARLHLEVVESRSLVDLPGVIEHLAELRQMGVRIALDDFGTGYSTLAWLQALPVDQVKIDRSFVDRLPDDAASLAVVRGVIALAQEIGLEVVAEGVETVEQLDSLRAAGCRSVQGYLLGRPAPILDVDLVVGRGHEDRKNADRGRADED